MSRGAVAKLLLGSLALATAAPAPAPSALGPEDVEMRVALEERQPEMEAQLADWVARNTGSWNTAGLEAFAPLVAAELEKLGFQVTVEPSAPFEHPDRKDARSGPLVIGERRATLEPERARSFLFLGHFDTVFEPDSPFQSLTPDPNSPGRALGPGASDMKGGLIVMLQALRALADAGDLARVDITVLLNSDEELGSLASRERIESAARKADYAFVFEASRVGGEMARSASGAGQFRLAVEGVAAHASNAATEGHSAIVALAKKVIAIESLTDFSRGILLNVGTIAGGTKRNIVPAHAEAWIDLRYDDAASGDEIRAKLEAIARATDVPGTTASLWGRLHRPPRPASPDASALLAQYQKLARELGYQAPDPVHSAAVTDGSLTAAVGLRTVDGMGVRGGASHTDREFIVLRSMSERAAIAAVFIRQLARTDEARARLARADP